MSLGSFSSYFKFTFFHCVQQRCLCASSRQEALYSICFMFTREFRDRVGRYMWPCNSQTRKYIHLVHLLHKKILNKDIYICASEHFSMRLWASEDKNDTVPVFTSPTQCLGSSKGMGAGGERWRLTDWESFTKETASWITTNWKLKSQAAFYASGGTLGMKINLIWA